MNIQNLIVILVCIGIGILFFFPNPESNFLAYFGTFLFFVILIVFLSIKSNKKNKLKQKKRSVRNRK